MAVETAVRPQTNAGQWSSIFPSEQISEQQSALFVKKLLAVGVSTITYLRTIFPEHAFGDRCLEDLNLKILRDDSSCPGACSVIKWMKDALMPWIKNISISILMILILSSSHTPSNLATLKVDPVWTFTEMKTKVSGAGSAKETKKATLRLLRTIIVLTQSLKLLPDEAMMTMKLLYYDEVTPTDYEPPGFKASPSDNFTYEDEPMNIRVGDVTTPFHTVKVRMKTDKSQFDINEDEEKEKEKEKVVKDVENSSEEIIDKGLDEEVDVIQEKQPAEHDKCQEPENCDNVPVESPVLPDKSSEAALVKPTSEEAKQSEDEYPVKCPCGLAEDDGLMIRCEDCETWQHAVCYKILSEEEAPSKHLCYACAKKSPENLTPTDPYLTNLKPANATALCLWRRSLIAATEFTKILLPSFAKRLSVEVPVARGLLNRLEKEGFVKAAGRGRAGRIVEVKKIKSEGFLKYFQKRSSETETKTEKKELQKKDEEGENIPEPELTEMESNEHQNEVESLTEKTAQMDVSSRSKRSKRKGLTSLQITEKGDNPSNTKTKKLPIKPVNSKKQKSRKRASISGNDFEISDSQETGSQKGRKRRKASSVSKPVVV
ncbi:putative HORMA domain-containing protein 1-like [Apostichopus japonicus]|uniref:Putative HORMA domain-containing protein 1-like n=1 Tax=Stichopus japonicus TaxID=307972 RepID=A0A2G8K6Z7_STIJA|nr:putative HORMA domain-containing protein 1-like [Apostichopus japonicus]